VGKRRQKEGRGKREEGRKKKEKERSVVLEVFKSRRICIGYLGYAVLLVL